MKKFLDVSLVVLLLFLVSSLPSYGAKIHDAVKKGDMEAVKLLLKENPNTLNEPDDSRDGSKYTPLHLAVSEKNRKMTEFPISRGADIESGDFWGRNPVELAVINGDNDLLKYFIKLGAKVNHKNARGFTLLHAAAECGDTDTIALLLDNGADLEAQGKENLTPLHIAAITRKNNNLRFLIKKGANVNARAVDSMLATHLVALNSREDILDILYRNGGDILSEDDRGMTPLKHAFQSYRMFNAEYLFSRGADVELSYLIENIRFNNWPIVYYLLLYSSKVKMFALSILSILIISSILSAMGIKSYLKRRKRKNSQDTGGRND